jgi:hypothetical protein
MECRQWRIWSRNFERFMEPDVHYRHLETWEVVIFMSRVDLFDKSLCAERYVPTGTNGKYRQLFKFTLALPLYATFNSCSFLVACAHVASQTFIL